MSGESRARGRARGPQHRGSRRTARPELAARQQSPRGAARLDAGTAQISLHRARRPRPPHLPSAQARAAPKSSAPCPGLDSSPAARRPASPPSKPPASGPAGESQGRQVGAGPGGAAGGEGRAEGRAARGTLPQLFFCAAHLVPLPPSQGSESGGEGATWSELAVPGTLYPGAPAGAPAGAPLLPARVTRLLARLPSRSRQSVRALPSALWPQAQPPPPRRALCPSPDFPSSGLWVLGPSVAPVPLFSPKGEGTAFYRTLPWLREGRPGCTSRVDPEPPTCLLAGLI